MQNTSKEKENQLLRQNLKVLEQTLKEKEIYNEQELLRIKDMNRQELEENKKLRAKVLAYQ